VNSRLQTSDSFAQYGLLDLFGCVVGEDAKNICDLGIRFACEGILAIGVPIDSIQSTVQCTYTEPKATEEEIAVALRAANIWR
jgi:hypothetical protein